MIQFYTNSCFVSNIFNLLLNFCIPTTKVIIFYWNFHHKTRENSTCDKEKISPGKKPNPLLSAILSSPSLGVSSRKRACIRSPWLDPLLTLCFGICFLGSELQKQHEDWDEVGSEDLRRGLVCKLGMCAEVERASMVDSTQRRIRLAWRVRSFTLADASVDFVESTAFKN